MDAWRTCPKYRIPTLLRLRLEDLNLISVRNRGASCSAGFALFHDAEIGMSGAMQAQFLTTDSVHSGDCPSRARSYEY